MHRRRESVVDGNAEHAVTGEIGGDVLLKAALVADRETAAVKNHDDRPEESAVLRAVEVERLQRVRSVGDISLTTSPVRGACSGHISAKLSWIICASRRAPISVIAVRAETGRFASCANAGDTETAVSSETISQLARRWPISSFDCGARPRTIAAGHFSVKKTSPRKLCADPADVVIALFGL